MTPKDVRELLDYDPDTGVMRWKQSRGRVKAGDIAGYDLGSGYVGIRILGRQFRLHRVAYLHFHGVWPKVIDHINGDRSDNRIANLRSVTQAENCKNSAIASHNKSGARGVFWNSGRRKWTARIMVRQKAIHLGNFDSKADAIAARKSAEKSYGFSDRHGIVLSMPEDMRSAA